MTRLLIFVTGLGMALIAGLCLWGAGLIVAGYPNIPYPAAMFVAGGGFLVALKLLEALSAMKTAFFASDVDIRE